MIHVAQYPKASISCPESRLAVLRARISTLPARLVVCHFVPLTSRTMPRIDQLSRASGVELELDLIHSLVVVTHSEENLEEVVLCYYHRVVRHQIWVVVQVEEPTPGMDLVLLGSDRSSVEQCQILPASGGLCSLYLRSAISAESIVSICWRIESTIC
jgi:hypothetical protein